VTLDHLPRGALRLELALDNLGALMRVEIFGATKNINIHEIVFGVSMGRKVAFGQDEYARRTYRLKLMKRLGDDIETTEVGNVSHDGIQVISLFNNHTRNMSDEVSHFL
jgi:hypothetical protein